MHFSCGCDLLPPATIGVRIDGSSRRRFALSTGAEQQEPPFGKRLRRLREAAALTQEELAGRAGLSPNAISDLERGRRRRPYPHTVRALADALELSGEERASLFAAVPKRGGGTA